MYLKPYTKLNPLLNLLLAKHFVVRLLVHHLCSNCGMSAIYFKNKPIKSVLPNTKIVSHFSVCSCIQLKQSIICNPHVLPRQVNLPHYLVADRLKSSLEVTFETI